VYVVSTLEFGFKMPTEEHGNFLWPETLRSAGQLKQ